MSVLASMYGSVRKARYLRRVQTSPERILWKRLRNKQLHGLKFRRQVPIGRYVVDFFCMERMVVIELDGYMHSWNRKHDLRRDRFLMQKGLKILRFPNHKIRNNLVDVLSIIRAECGAPDTNDYQ